MQPDGPLTANQSERWRTAHSLYRLCKAEKASKIMSATEISNVAWWQKAGLPGMPIWAKTRGKITDPAFLIRDSNSKPVLYEKPNSEQLREALMLHLGRGVKIVQFVTDIMAYECRPDYTAASAKYTSPIVAFATASDSDGPLSIVERIGVKVITDMFTNYSLVIPTSESYRLPRIFNEYRQDHPEDAWGVPAKVASEEKAFQFAQVAERVLSTPAEIVPEPDGSFFVVIPHTDRIIQNDALLRLYYAIDILNVFDVFPGDEGMIAVDEDGQEMYNRSLDGAEAYMVHKRVESKLDVILAHLGHPGADSHTLPVPRKPTPKAPPVNKRNGKAGGKKSSSSKQSA